MYNHAILMCHYTRHTKITQKSLWNIPIFVISYIIIIILFQIWLLKHEKLYLTLVEPLIFVFRDGTLTKLFMSSR